MKCPNCHEEYTFDEPCACHKPMQVPAVQPGPLHVYTGSDDETKPTLAPTGIDNPFWKV